MAGNKSKADCLFVGVWRSKYGTGIGVYPTYQDALLASANCVLMGVDAGFVEEEHAMQLVELYRSGKYKELIESYAAYSDDDMWLEDHPAVAAGDESSRSRPASEAELDRLVEQIRGWSFPAS